jgi:hypothetical protein
MLGNDSFLEPSHRFPTLEFHKDLIGVDVFEEIEEYVTLDGVACKVEGFISLYERESHD